MEVCLWLYGSGLMLFKTNCWSLVACDILNTIDHIHTCTPIMFILRVRLKEMPNSPRGIGLPQFLLLKQLTAPSPVGPSRPRAVFSLMASVVQLLNWAAQLGAPPTDSASLSYFCFQPFFNSSNSAVLSVSFYSHFVMYIHTCIHTHRHTYTNIYTCIHTYIYCVMYKVWS